MSQSAKILLHLKAGHTITSLNALRLFGTMRLAARIHALREEGHAIKAENIQLKNGKRIAAYYL